MVTNGKHNIYRDNAVHVLDEECKTCIFKPHTRPVSGARVAEMVRDTIDIDGASVVCHSTLMTRPKRNAICRGWYDRMADRDPILRLAEKMGIIKEQHLDNTDTRD